MSAPEAAKHIDIDADVIGRDGKKLGEVAYIVVKPPKMQITDIVVRTGAILGRDCVVPVNVIKNAEKDKVYVSIDKDEIEEYPEYIELHYQQPPPDWIPPEDRYYWLAVPSDIESVRINIAAGTHGIREGMDVKTKDGHRVGSIDAVDIDPVSDLVSGFVVKKGILFTHDTLIPAGDVLEICDDKVILKLTKDQIEEVEREQRLRTS